MIANGSPVCRRIIANKFNNYFVSLATNLNTIAYSDIPITAFPSFQSYLYMPCKKTIFMYDCDSDEINCIIREFESGKSSDIPIKLIKWSNSIIAPILASLYNKCMNSGLFPTILKVGRITPIYKNGNRELIEKYRPYLLYQFLAKYLKKSYTQDCTFFHISRHNIWLPIWI